jgi:hypothetical protein
MKHNLSPCRLVILSSPKFRGLESNQHQRLQRPMSYRLDDPGMSAFRRGALPKGSGRRGRTFIAWFKARKPTG